MKQKIKHIGEDAEKLKSPYKDYAKSSWKMELKYKFTLVQNNFEIFGKVVHDMHSPRTFGNTLIQCSVGM